MLKSKYKYDYPENRLIGKSLTSSDRSEIASYLNLSEQYMRKIFIYGDRTNKRAVMIAKEIIKQKKERKLIFTSQNKNS